MNARQGGLQHSVEGTNLADLLERVLDKGIVIAGDIRIKLVDVELLTLQIRLVVCSVDRAREMGMDWWGNGGVFGNDRRDEALTRIDERLDRLEGRLSPDR